MKIKLDENLPESLMEALKLLGHDVDNVRLEGIAGMDDGTVWQAAQTEGRFLITQDLDFSDIRRFSPGTHWGLMLVRLPSAGRLELAERVAAVFSNEDVNGWTGCFTVLGEHKLRIHRPA